MKSRAPYIVGHGERSVVESIEVLQRIADEAEQEEVKKACKDAIRALEELPALRNRVSRSVPVPCKIGEKIYSIIGEKVSEYIIDGYRIEKDEIYMTSDSIFFQVSKIGKYYFLSRPVAQIAFNKMYKGEKTDNGRQNISQEAYE